MVRLLLSIAGMALPMSQRSRKPFIATVVVFDLLLRYRSDTSGSIAVHRFADDLNPSCAVIFDLLCRSISIFIFHIGIVRATSLGFFAIDKQCDHHRGKGGLQLAKSDIFIIFIYKGRLNLRMLFVRSVLASYGSGAVGGGGFGVNSSWSNEFSLKEKTKTKRA
ncbi:unnamed protein product [Camellia sinensis]